MQIPKWNRSQQLFSAVPWLWHSDFDEGPRAMWELDYCNERTTCWPVVFHERRWDGGQGQQYLLIHATRGDGNDGGRITLALSETPHFDVYAKEQFAIAGIQSNPRRKYVERDLD